ncbi:hypothetical protein I4F81_006151 [Pyropia yezoensis]|uniref:Uncharacterized protein n=1 Tax=Pyropia yezoensis TaxID=2788 RepID=A0ACC3C0D5_PYRYE|nr:hypothetical protein I4F81_006151 [Neopyropia yezoensis]
MQGKGAPCRPSEREEYRGGTSPRQAATGAAQQIRNAAVLAAAAAACATTHAGGGPPRRRVAFCGAVPAEYPAPSRSRNSQWYVVASAATPDGAGHGSRRPAGAQQLLGHVGVPQTVQCGFPRAPLSVWEPARATSSRGRCCGATPARRVARTHGWAFTYGSGHASSRTVRVAVRASKPRSLPRWAALTRTSSAEARDSFIGRGWQPEIGNDGALAAARREGLVHVCQVLRRLLGRR